MLADFMDEGFPPVGGGLYDQTVSFIEGLRLYRDALAENREEVKKRTEGK